jgi:hypothetical protein
VAFWLLSMAHATTGDEIVRAIELCNAGAVHRLPDLDPAQREELVSGAVVRVLTRNPDPEGPSTAVGLAVLDGPRDALWLAAQDPHTVVDTSLVEFTIEEKSADHAIWYGHMDLPRPIRDRQWVVESKNNHGLSASTDGRCWEHEWQLVPDALEQVRAHVARTGTTRITAEQLDDAIYTPVNHGGWMLASLPDGRTLVAYQATSVVGGSIPDWLVLQLTMSRLEGVLREVQARARTWVPSHYGPDHAPVPGADGRPIPRLE